MIQMNRISHRMFRKTASVVGAAVLGIAVLSSPVTGQDAAPPATQATTKPSSRLVAEGIGEDGRLRLTVNKTTVVTTTTPYKQVSVGQPDIADVNLIGPNNILVTAKKTGSTQLIVWDDNGRSQVADIIVDMDLDTLNSELKSMFPGSKITVSPMNGAIALRGQVADLKTAEQAVSVAGPYSPRVLNFLEVGGGQQVLLQVRFAEVSRRATSQLGVNFGFTDGTAIGGTNLSGGAPGFNLVTEGGVNFLGVPQTTSGFTLFGQAGIGDTAVVAFINALRQNNLLRILAEPNLIAMSGQEASFLAGGEFPYPVPQAGAGGGSTITIEYREFGVRLRFTPVVLGNGKIRLKMTPEVSDLDFSSPLSIEGSVIPIVNKRTVTTTVELADGQTFAIAGLLDNNLAATRSVTPLLGDIPVLGTLFRSTRYERRETELVVIVTPKLVEPMNPNQVPQLPGEDWRHPKEADQFFGLIEADIGSEKVRPAPATESQPGQPVPTSAGGTDDSPRYRGSYGFTPPPRQPTTTGTE
jgi:pilus assembly protein CpaC